MRLIRLLVLLALSTPLFAQWQGDTDKYRIYPDSLQLFEIDSDGGLAYLSKSSTVVEDAVWEFSVAIKQGTSGSNYASVYLMSDAADLMGNGYFVRIGNAADEISLYRQDGNSSKVIINGYDKRIDFTPMVVRVRVTCDKDRLWRLSSKIQEENDFVFKDSVIDATYLSSSYFGVKSTYTSSRDEETSFYHFSISGSAIVDDVAPRLDSLVSLTQYQCRLYFNEVVTVSDISYDGASSKDVLVEGKTLKVSFDSPFLENDSSLLSINVSDTSNNALVRNANLYYENYEVLFARMQSADILTFNLNKETLSVATQSVTLDGQHPFTIILDGDNWLASFSTPISPRTLLHLQIDDVLDLNGDSLKTYSTEIGFFETQSRDLVFNEVMPDPTPKVSTLPEVEYVELYNNNDFEITLTNWYLQRDSTTTYLIPLSRIEAHGYLLLGKAAAMDSFPSINNKVALPSFPSLLNSGMTLKLKTDEGLVVDSLTYSSNWHTSEAKNGGYALSRIDPQGPSGESNFQSSCSEDGGTPGTVNCDEPPVLVSSTVLTKNKFQLAFNEKVLVDSIVYDGHHPIVTEIEDNSVTATFSDVFPERDSFQVSIHVQDINANILNGDVELFYTPFEVTSVVMETGDEMRFTLNKPALNIVPEQILLNGERPLTVLQDSLSFVASFATVLENRTTAPLQIKGILDINGDTLKTYTTDISFFVAEFGDIVFTELMPDPTPIVGDLPEAEYIELFNRTDFSISLDGWQLVKDDKNYALPTYQMSAYETLIVVAQSTQSLFVDSINALAMEAFPTLSNSGMSLQMISDKGVLIDLVDYDDKWHEDGFKGDGGFSLERIDVDNPSQLENWTSTCSSNGGTPGAENCVASDNPDYVSPYVVSAYAVDNSTIILELSEQVLNSSLVQVNYYTLSGGLSVTNVSPLGDLSITNQVMLGISGDMTSEVVYELHISDIEDMSGNLMEASVHYVAVCRLPVKSEIVINEIMYAPFSGEAEYIEIYNTTEVPFDLSEIKITQQESDGSWAAGKSLITTPTLLLPRSYLVLSADIDLLKEQYSIEESSAMGVAGMSSFGNESDVVALMLKNATLIDVLYYDNEWQSALLNDTKGVALERLNTHTATNEPSNWFSASSLVNYGTPGAENSQQSEGENATEGLRISPEVFTPNGDGTDDFTTIYIDAKYEGGTVRVQVFNHRGIVVQELTNNALIGSYSDIRWDGTDSTGDRCPMGAYIVWVEIVMPQGDVITKKMECVVSVRVK